MEPESRSHAGLEVNTYRYFAATILQFEPARRVRRLGFLTGLPR